MGVNVWKVRGGENAFIIRAAEHGVACTEVPSVFQSVHLCFLLQYDYLLHVFHSLRASAGKLNYQNLKYTNMHFECIHSAVYQLLRYIIISKHNHLLSVMLITATCFDSTESSSGYLRTVFNPLNAELNPICHLLALLGDLTFIGPCIVSIFQYISNKMQRYTFYLCLKTALHVPGGTSTHHQERKQLYLQHLVFVTPLLLSAAIVEELELV